MSSRKWVKDYFVFTKKDRIGVFVLVVVVGCCVMLPPLLAKKRAEVAVKQDSVLLLALDTLQRRETAKRTFNRDETEDYSYNRLEPSDTKTFLPGELFFFDPNTASLSEWRRLGLNERTAKTILKYVNKGGKFYRPEDLQKIWSMPEGFYERVKSHVRITSIARTYSVYENKPFEREERRPVTVNINEADTSAFIALPGIGSKLSARIVSFREKLGGFYSVEQIGETYGLPDSTFQKIKTRLQLSSGEVRKMNINTASKDDLKAHPYIRWNLANAIVEYRNQHGAFKSLEELKNIVLIDEATYQKIYRYLNL